MIESILKIIDRVIDLMERRATTNRGIYEDQVEPIFSEIILIHKDYRSIFDEADKLINSEDVPVEEIIITLQNRRKELEIVREKVTALGWVLSRNKNLPKIAFSFFESVHWYFDTASDNDSYKSASSAITNLMDLLDKLDANSEHMRSNMKYDIQSVKSELESRWNRLLHAYASARVELLL